MRRRIWNINDRERRPARKHGGLVWTVEGPFSPRVLAGRRRGSPHFTATRVSLYRDVTDDRPAGRRPRARRGTVEPAPRRASSVEERQRRWTSARRTAGRDAYWSIVDEVR